MRPDLDYLHYDPANFAEDHPDDPKLIEARKSATDLAAQLKPQQDGETATDAKHRVEQAFDELQTRTGDRMGEFHKGELHQLKQSHYNQRLTEIAGKWQDAYKGARTSELALGSLGAQNEDVKHLAQQAKENFRGAEEYQDKVAQLQGLQGARYEACSAEIHRINEARVQELGLNPDPSSPKQPEEAWSNALSLLDDFGTASMQRAVEKGLQKSREAESRTPE